MRSPLRKVMVPLDGSPPSRQALGIGAGIARREGAGLDLVTVIPKLAHAVVEQALRQGSRRYLEEQAAAVRRKAPEVAVTCRVLDGNVAGLLAQYARTEDIDLVVMTTHGWGGLKRLWLGSVAQVLVHRVPCPTLLIRPSGEPPGFGLHRILVALETADDADALLEPALALGSLAGDAHYALLQVVEPHPPLLLRLAGISQRTVRDWAGQIADEADRRLERVSSRLRHRGVRAEPRVMVEHGAGEQILRLARRSGCDLIVVGTRATGLERAVFGSVADKVVRGATQMVLVVPLGAETTREATGAEEAKAMAPEAAYA